MIRTLLQLASAAALLAVVALPGCGGPEPSAEPAPALPPGHFEGDGHDHGAAETSQVETDGHDHGEAAAQEHPTEGPHGGHLIELGDEEYHAELLHDQGTSTVTVYLLDAAGKQPFAVPQPEIVLQLFQNGRFAKYALKAATAGEASEFQLVDAALCDALAHEEEIRGRLQVTIGGKPYVGTIEHAAHDDHEHEGDEH